MPADTNDGWREIEKKIQPDDNSISYSKLRSSLAQIHPAD